MKVDRDNPDETSGEAPDCFRLASGILCVFFPGGVFRLQGNSWQWAESESLVWDRAHQAVFRNFRAEKVDLPESAPPLPEPPKARRSRKREPDSYEVPAKVAEWVREGGGERTAVILLSEDRWESTFGDGMLLGAEGCFPSEEACDEHLAERGEQRFVRYHRRKLRIVGQAGEVRALKLEERHWADRFTVPEVLKDLAERLEGHG